MWVAIDIQMKRGQFGLVKAIMPTSVCRGMCVRTCMEAQLYVCVCVGLLAFVGKKSE